MNKIFKTTMFSFIILMLVGCLNNIGPSERVEEMLNKYIKNDQDIMLELDTYLEKQDLTKEQKKKYKEIIKEEYSTIKYDIKNEKINGDNAFVEISIEVKDIYKPTKESENYLIENPTEFYRDGTYDANKYIDFKLNNIEKSNNTVTYTIYIELIKKEEKWIIENIDELTLEKIHGIYNYEIDE